MAKYKVGKGKHYEDYCMSVLRVMYEADIVKFSLGQFVDWAGLAPTSTAKRFLDKLVIRGWLSVEPQELRDGRHKTVYVIQSVVWFGSTKHD